MYFPGNYRWSAAFVNMLGRASYGGADISELHKIGRALTGKDAEDDQAWFDAWAITYARRSHGGVRKRSHDARWLPSRSTVINFQFYCDVSQFDFMSQITGTTAANPTDGGEGVRSIPQANADYPRIQPAPN